MKTAFLTIKVEPELREKVGKMAKKERRSLADQTAYLMELGLGVIERQPDPLNPQYSMPGSGPRMGAALAEEAV